MEEATHVKEAQIALHILRTLPVHLPIQHTTGLSLEFGSDKHKQFLGHIDLECAKHGFTGESITNIRRLVALGVEAVSESRTAIPHDRPAGFIYQRIAL